MAVAASALVGTGLIATAQPAGASVGNSCNTSWGIGQGRFNGTPGTESVQAYDYLNNPAYPMHAEFVMGSQYVNSGTTTGGWSSWGSQTFYGTGTGTLILWVYNGFTGQWSQGCSVNQTIL